MKIKVPKIPFQSMAKSFQSLTIKTWAVLTASPDISSLTPQSCLAVSIHSGTVSFIYLTRKLKKYTVQAERVFRFTEKLFPQPRDILSYVHIFFDETGLPRVPIIIVVPKSWVIIKRGELPIAVENFLSEAVANEMDTLTPFSVEEVLYDFTIVQRTRRS
jgi:Tfp pilus assembly PilM family ATPase